ncbi:MAG: site-specific [Gallionellaceae bacterium]|nr:MAG: site-specific [Gallionellaceae bacterium]
MRTPRTYYELSNSQVSTPAPIVSFYWDIVKQYRPQLQRVIDLGAGDARFSHGGHFEEYVGVEIDPNAVQHIRPSSPKQIKSSPNTFEQIQLTSRSRIELGCAFRFKETGFSACIGNPPYVRHHDIESPWKEDTANYLAKELDFSFNMHGNLFLYFIALGLLKTSDDGLLAMVVPFEWVSRPSSKGLRNLINKHKWDVSIYRFQESIFDGVLTTACITIIDKNSNNGNWQYFDVSEDLQVSPRKGISGTDQEILQHSNRSEVWARRGISPGSQDIFTLTDGQRIHFGLTLDDVIPCVTTLRHVPKSLRMLTSKTFNKYFVDEGKLCWLIKSNEHPISDQLQAYLDSIPESDRQTYTCINQFPWYDYEKSAIPDLLIHSGFTSFGPKVLINSIGAQTVGSVFGIHTTRKNVLRSIQEYLLDIDFESQVVAQANSFKKIEVRQMNTILNNWVKKF